MTKTITRESIKVLDECIELQTKKSADYQADVSEIKQAEYYPHGVTTIYDIMHAKMLRIKSVLAKIEAGHDNPNFESVEDSCKDLINYSSFMVSYLRGKMDGQTTDRDIFNRIMQFDAQQTVQSTSANNAELDKIYQRLYDRLQEEDRSTHHWRSASRVDF